jgi:hypothetical protein
MVSKWLGTCALLLASVSSAWSNYSIGTIVNNSGQTVTVSFPVAAGTHDQLNQQFSSWPGNFAVGMIGFGIIYFEDKGHNTDCLRPYWGVKITYKDKAWGFFYDAAGIVNITIDATGNPTFTAPAPSQIIVGNGPPTCRQK